MERVEAIGSVRRVCAGEGTGQSTVEADLVVHGAGRVPDVDELNLEAAGVQYSLAGVTVNAYLQSVSNPMVYAAGDCTGTSGQIVAMAAEGTRAAYAINRDLVQEDLAEKRTVFTSGGSIGKTTDA